MRKRDVHRMMDNMQDAPILQGKELEFSLLGPGAGSHYDPERVHQGETEKEIADRANLPKARDVVTAELNKLEQKGSIASEEDTDFKYADITTHPETPYAYGMYEELCRLLQCEDPSEKKIRYYNTLGTILDNRFGTDFLVEVQSNALPESKFGKEVRRAGEKIYVSVDITGNLAKSAHKADIVLQYDKLPDNKEERVSWGKKAALRIVEQIIQKIGSVSVGKYQPPIVSEIERIREQERQEAIGQQKERGKTTTIRRGVVRRVREIGSNQ